MSPSPSSPQKKNDDDAGLFKGWWVLLLVFCLFFLGLLGFMFMRGRVNNKALNLGRNNVVRWNRQ